MIISGALNRSQKRSAQTPDKYLTKLSLNRRPTAGEHDRTNTLCRSTFCLRIEHFTSAHQSDRLHTARCGEIIPVNGHFRHRNKCISHLHYYADGA